MVLNSRAITLGSGSIQNIANQDSLQVQWPANVTACFRPSSDLNMTYLATAGLDQRTATSDGVGDLFKQLASCCEGPSIYFSRTDCDGVGCFTNDRALVERWGSCVAEKRNDTSVFAHKIDYGYLRTGKVSGASALATRSGLLVACLLGASLIPAI